MASDTISGVLERAKALELRITDSQLILTTASAFANQRWAKFPAPGTFRQDLRNEDAQPVYHVLTTSTALSAMLRSPTLFEPSKIEAFKGLHPDNIASFYQSAWTPNGWGSMSSSKWIPYVCASALTAIGMVFSKETPVPGGLAEKVKAQASALVDFLGRWGDEKLRDEERDFDHVYFVDLSLQAIASLAASVERGGLSSDVLGKWPDVRSHVARRLRLMFFREMTLRLSDLHQHLDVINLALSLCALSDPLMSEGGSDASDLGEDVVDAGLDAVFGLQQQSGFWATSAPLLGSSTGLVGCSTIELAQRLLGLTRVAARFEEFVPHFDRLFNQIFRGFDRRRPEQGWPVDIKRSGSRRQTWYGFAVLEFVDSFGRRVRDLAATLILKGFRYQRIKPKLTWAALSLDGAVRERINRDFIEPRKRATSENKAQAKTPNCSMIVFGPPGTGKTSFASALADELGWGLIELGPGDFLSAGKDGVFAQADLIFQRLLLLEKVVVFFDEVEEFVVDRELDNNSKEDRFLTTYMLPWLQRLRDRGAIVFVFATNKIKRFDPAITRPGRFDIVVPLGPPQGEIRIGVLKSVLSGLDDNLVRELHEKLPPQVAYGEITRAYGALAAEHKDAALVEQLISKLLPAKITVSNADWNEFVSDAEKHFGPSSYKAVVATQHE